MVLPRNLPFPTAICASACVESMTNATSDSAAVDSRAPIVLIDSMIPPP
jgi:hypothetical protein